MELKNRRTTSLTRGKDWVPVKFISFYLRFLWTIKWYIDLIMVFMNIMLILNWKANYCPVFSSFWGGGPFVAQVNTWGRKKSLIFTDLSKFPELSQMFWNPFSNSLIFPSSPGFLGRWKPWIVLRLRLKRHTALVQSDLSSQQNSRALPVAQAAVVLVLDCLIFSVCKSIDYRIAVPFNSR